MTDDKKRPKQGPKPEVNPEVDAPIAAADKTHTSDETKLDTGMKVGEAIQSAAVWWELKGRALMMDKNKASDNPGFGSFTPDPSNDEEAKNWLPSGVLAGKPWTDLTKEEKLRVTKIWHHHHVRVPNIDPELWLRAKKRMGVCFYCDEESCADEELPNGERRELCWGHYLDRYPVEAQAVMEANAKGKPANDG